MRILHLSDLHFGKNHFFSGAPSTLADIVVRDGRVGDVDLVVLSGDLTWAATEGEFEHAFDFIRAVHSHLGCRFLVVPGNHDVSFNDRFVSDAVPILHDDRQERFFDLVRRLNDLGVIGALPFDGDDRLPRREQLITVEEGANWLAIGTNSAALLGQHPQQIEYPVAVTPATFRALDLLMANRRPDVAQIRIFVLHHHLLPFVEPNWGPTDDGDADLGMEPDSSLVANSGQLQAWLATHQFQVVFHGHKHIAHGRMDQLWTGRQEENRQVIVIGGGSAGVSGNYRPNQEPLCYNLVDVEQTSDGSTQTRVFTQQITRVSGLHRPAPRHEFVAETISEERRHAVNYFYGLTSTDCHAAIARALQSQQRIQNFISVVRDHEYHHPPTLRWRDETVTVELVESAYRALEPHLAAGPTQPGQRSREARGRKLRHQLEHGSRIFHSQLGIPGSSPFTQALRALTTSAGGRRSYIGLFNTEIDTLPDVETPPPGLVGIQFVLEETSTGQHLNLVASFRHIELSFWWGVNVLEMSRLLRRAINEAGLERTPRPGSITFFAALAAWEHDPDLVASADLDVLATRDLVGLVADSMTNSHSPSLDRLVSLLEQKRDYTNIANIDTVGLHELVEVIRGLTSVVDLAGRRQAWDDAAKHLASAVRQLDEAVVGPAVERPDQVDSALNRIVAAVVALSSARPSRPVAT